MRETRTSGSEGGGAELNRLSLPLSLQHLRPSWILMVLLKALDQRASVNQIA